MQEPSGELIELDFYFSAGSCADALHQVVHHCLARGGTFSGEVLAVEREGARNEAFESPYTPGARVIEATHAELEDLLVRPDVRILKVPIWKAIGITGHVPEIVTFSGLSRQALASGDNAAVAIVSEASPLELDNGLIADADVGDKCYSVFAGFCESLQPDYAAILNENSLACRADLGQETARECFLNFFVSDKYGESVVNRLIGMYTDAFVQPVEGGVIVSTCSLFNPSHVAIDIEEALRRSARVAKILEMASMS